MLRIGNFSGRRLQVRAVNADHQAQKALEAAQQMGVSKLRVAIGGTVANKYGYPAETEAVLTVAFPDGRGIQILSRIPANKATLGGAAAACCRRAGAPNLRPLWDDRFGAAARTRARAEFIAWANEQAPVTPDTDPGAVMVETVPVTRDDFAVQLA